MSHSTLELLSKHLKIAPTSLGNILMMIALTLYIIADAICKQFLQEYPAAQVTLFRTISRLIPILITCCIVKRDPARTSRFSEHVLRGVIASINTIMFICAYKYSPMTDVNAIGYTSAFFILPISYFLLGEKIRPTSIFAAFVGLIGTTIILQPNFNQVNFSNIGGAFALTGAILAAVNNVLIRKLSSTEHVLTIVFYHNVVLLIISSLFCCFSWHEISDYRSFIIDFCIIGIISTLSQYLISYALSITKASDLAVTNYITIIPVMLTDFFMWRNVPTFSVVLGMLLIIFCNYIVIKRQQEK